jgi:CRP/FNR family transcriptional regulator
VALLGETSYPAIGTAEKKLSLFGVPQNVFLEMVLKSPAFRVFVFNSLSQRMAHLMALIDDVAFRRVDQRLACGCSSTSRHHCNPSDARDELGTTRRSRESNPGGLPASGMLRLPKADRDPDRNALDRPPPSAA